MADHEVTSAEELDQMTPDQRAGVVRAGIVTDWDEVPAEFRASVEATAALLAEQLDQRPAG